MPMRSQCHWPWELCLKESIDPFLGCNWPPRRLHCIHYCLFTELLQKPVVWVPQDLEMFPWVNLLRHFAGLIFQDHPTRGNAYTVFRSLSQHDSGCPPWLKSRKFNDCRSLWKCLCSPEVEWSYWDHPKSCFFSQPAPSISTAWPLKVV